VVLRHRQKGPSKKVGATRAKSAKATRAQYEELVKADKLRSLMAKYDKSREGKLNQQELSQLLKDNAGGVEPTEEELQFVLMTADQSDGRINGQVNLHELEVALQCHLALRQNKAEVEKYFAKYDLDKDGMLDRPELAKLLNDLNEGKEVEEEELDWIMANADGKIMESSGGIRKTELIYALSLWYSHVEDAHAACGGKSCSIQ